MIDELMGSHSQWLTYARLVEGRSFTDSGGTMGAYLGTLRRNGLVTVVDDAEQPSEMHFFG